MDISSTPINAPCPSNQGYATVQPIVSPSARAMFHAAPHAACVVPPTGSNRTEHHPDGIPSASSRSLAASDNPAPTSLDMSSCARTAADHRHATAERYAAAGRAHARDGDGECICTPAEYVASTAEAADARAQALQLQLDQMQDQMQQMMRLQAKTIADADAREKALSAQLKAVNAQSSTSHQPPRPA